MELGNLATWIGVAVSVAIGIAGFCTAVSANRRAARAVAAAEKSNSIAREANEISVASNAIAKESNVIAERADLRATEKHDVRWDGHWQEAGLYRLVNIGRDAAHNAYAELQVADEIQREEALEVPSGGFIEFDMPNAGMQWFRQVETMNERRNRRPRFESPVAQAMSSFELNDQSEFSVYLRELVHWDSESGTPHTYEDNWPMSSLEPRPK